MANGQLGTINVGAQLATEPTSPQAPDQVLPTKSQTAGVAGSTTFNTYDLVYPWGVAESWVGWGVSGGATDPVDVVNAYPHLFPKDVTIANILIKNNVGVPGTRYKIALYSNLGNGSVYPNTKLVEFTEQNPLGPGITTWSLNYPVAAGTLLWLVQTCDNNPGNINLSSVLMSASELMGTDGTLSNEAINAWQHARVYDGTLPVQYPTAAPVPLRGAAHTAPALFMRFAP